MEARAGALILCLLCVARTSAMHPEERVVGFEEGALRYEAPSGMPRGSNESEGQSANRLREKRALGLLLSGLAQIFGYTVTPIQIASLPNSTTRPAAMNPAGNATKQQVASSQPASANATMPPRRQETIRFTGVVNFGNNSDILGHLQRYERIFHGGGGNTTTTPKPAPMSATNTSVDPRSKAPLLAPFFVKIPLPIAPNLPPATMPIRDFKLSYPVPLISIASGLSKNAEAETPVRKEQETVYRNNEDTEQYTLEEKDIYDEKDVSKPPDDYNRESYVGDPSYNQQQDDRYDNVQRKQQKHVERLKEQEDQRDRDRDAHYREDEIDERHRNREKEIANRNREYASKHEPKEEKRPAHDEDEEEEEEDGNSAEKHEEHASQANESSKESMKNQRDKSEEDYPDRDDVDKPFDGYKYPSLDKYIEMGNDRELPIGDYFHEGNPEVIRDSYGEVLDNKKLQDDRLSGYFSMFKQPHTDVGESQEVRNAEDASSKEDEGRASPTRSYYDEHLDKLQKLRDEYALPESKYEEYDVNDERGGDREDRESERLRNRTSERSKSLETGRPRGAKGGGRARAPTERDGAEAPARFEDAGSQEEVNLARYMPLIVPVRYIDASDKLQQEMTRQGSNENEPMRNGFPEGNVDSTASREKLALPIGLPKRSRQLYEDEGKGLQIWPPPFDYVFDNTEPANAVVLPNHQHVRSLTASNDNDNSSGYVLVVNSPTHPYGDPYELYYFPNEAADQNPHLDTKSASSRVPHVPHVPRASPDATGRILNETGRDFRDHRPREIPIDHLDRYKYVFEERTSQDQTPQSPDANKNARSQIINSEDQSSGMQARARDQATKSPIAASRDAASSNYPRAQDKSPERPRHSLASRRKLNNSRSEDQREDGGRTDPSLSRGRSKFGDPRSTRDSLIADNGFGMVSKVTEVKAKAAGGSSAPVAPEMAAYLAADATRPKRKKRKPTSGNTGARSRS